MATIVTRTGKGSALSAAEADANFTNLNTDKIELTNLSVSTATGAETSALSYNNTTGVFTFTPVSTLDLIALTDISVGTPGAASGSGSLAYNNTTGVFTYTPPDLSSYGTLSNVVEDTTPQLGGHLDVQTSNIFTSTTNGSIGLSPNGTGAVNILTGTGLNIAPNAGASKIFTSSNGNLVLDPDGTGVIKLGKNLDVEARAITTSTTNGDILLTANGTGRVKSSTGFDAANGVLTTSTTDGNITITANGDGIISLGSATAISFLDAYSETIDVLAGVSGTLTIDPTAGPIKYVVPAGNFTINGFSSPVSGQTVSFLIDQSTNTTNFSITLGAGILLPGGTAPTLTNSGNDLLTITCLDDVNGVYIATFVADFQ